MTEFNLLLGKAKRRGSRNENNVLQADIVSTSKPLIRKDISSMVDLYNVYMEEYGKCDKYRITLTLKPYCTNVLYNVCTEVVKEEGSDNCFAVSDSVSASTLSPYEVCGLYNETDGIYRNYMVSNTEYSSPDIGYEYFPGYDMFDNHTLRNLSFRPIMPVSMDVLQSGDTQTRMCFNTVRDFMRNKDGDTIKFRPRYSQGDIENNTILGMHVYEESNLLPFIDGSSSEANLIVENGWYGFVNSSSLVDGYEGKIGSTIPKTHIFSHTINNTGNCQFIDMFPDRSRFSLVPKYNKYRKRYEKNWDVFLTYPWKKFYNHNLIANIKTFNVSNLEDGDKETHALATMRVMRTRVSTNRETLLFRTFCKHGVSVNDKIAVYLSKDSGKTYKRLPRVYTVDYIGDIDGNNGDYFFGVSTKTLLNDIFVGSIQTPGLFYTSVPNSVRADYSISNEITEVPTEVSAKVLCVFDYVTDEHPQQSYSDEMTYDSMPKTVNALSLPYIRVWNGEYQYKTWDYDNEEYVPGVMGVSVEYGSWNTFTDVPEEFTHESIRVKSYGYFTRRVRQYKMKDALLSGSVTIDGVINGLFEPDANATDTWNVRFVKVVNDVDCEYYIRRFRKVPNLKFSSEPLELSVSQNDDAYESFIEENASDENGAMLEFDSETYKLAFSKTLYGDDVAQVTFLDNISVNNLTDNLGRPVSEIYATVVKRNKGFREWYANMGSDYSNIENSEDIEFSRCFGSVTTGFEYLDLDDDFDRQDVVRNIKSFMSSAASIYRDDNVSNPTMTVEDWDDDREIKEISETDSVFYGDVVEYNPAKCLETVLANGCFRFNTAQREIGDSSDGGDFDFTYTELVYDDFDPTDSKRRVPFKAVTYKQWLQDGDNVSSGEIVVDGQNNISVRRREGYFYKPHTRIPLLKYGDNIQQGSHRTLRVKECRPLQVDTILIKVTTATMHGVGNNNTVYVCDGNNWCALEVAYVLDNFSFTLAPMSKEDAIRNGVPYIDWVEICHGVMDGSLKLRVRNESIPSYATVIGENLFVWREIINPAALPETDSYKHPFSNNAFYVDRTVNIYLQRQDPMGVNNLYQGEIGEIPGNPRVNKNNQYKDERNIICY